MTNYKNMDIDELKRLDNKILTEQNFEELTKNKNIAWWELNEDNKSYCVRIKNVFKGEYIDIEVFVS